MTAGAAAQLREGTGSLKGGVSETRDGLVLPPDTIYHLGFVGKDWEMCCLWGPVVLSIMLFQRVIILVKMCAHGLRRLVSWDVCARTGEASGSGCVCTDERGYWDVCAKTREGSKGSMIPDFLVCLLRC